MTSEHETRKQVEEDAHEDLELAEGDAEGIAGGDKAKQQKVEYLKITMSDAFVTGVSGE